MIHSLIDYTAKRLDLALLITLQIVQEFEDNLSLAKPLFWKFGLPRVEKYKRNWFLDPTKDVEETLLVLLEISF